MKSQITWETFEDSILPGIMPELRKQKDKAARKSWLVEHLKSKMIEVVDENGEPIDLNGTLVISMSAPMTDAEDEDDEEMKADGEEEEEKATDEDEEEKSAARIAAMVLKQLQSSKPTHKGKRHVVVTGNERPGNFNPTLMPATVKRYGRIKNFKGKRYDMDPDVRAYRFGMFCLDRIQRSIPQLNGKFPAATRYCKDYGLHTKLHSEGTNTAGGYLVPDEFGTDIIDLREERGVLRRIARVEPMSSDTKTIPRRAGGLTASYVGEGAAGTESTKSWDQVRLVAKKVMALTRYTAELDEDAVINIGDDLAGEIAYAFADREDTDGFNGTGISTNGGITGIRTRLSDISSAAGLIDGTSNTWAAMTLGDLESVAGALPQYADTPNTVWVCHRAFYWTVMLRLAIASGGTTSEHVQEGPFRGSPLFLQYPVVFSQVFPSETATSTVSALLGDFTLGCTLGDRSTLAVDFSAEASVGGESLWERGEIGVRGIGRWDFVAHDLGDDTDAGPIVGITTGS